jgi:hypothetical protein
VYRKGETIMAHFVRPPSGSSEGYDADNKLAAGSLWRVRIPLGHTRTVALWGRDGLKVTSNNPAVVPNELPRGCQQGPPGLKELPQSGDLRIFELFGASKGGSFIDVWGTDGAFWIRLQALVAAVATASQAGKAVFARMDDCGIAALDEIQSRSNTGGVRRQLHGTVTTQAVQGVESGRVVLAQTLEPAALAAVVQRSPDTTEYSGLIFRRGAPFGFTAPVRGEPDSALKLGFDADGGTPADIQAAIQRALNDAKGRVPAGSDPVGTYHTHGNKQGAGESFSWNDRGFHNLRHWFAYLGTRSRAILRFTPKDRPADENVALAAFGGTAERLR